MARQITVSIVGDASKFDDATKQVESKASGLGSKLNKVAKVAAVGVIGALGKSMKDGFGGVMEGVHAEEELSEALSRSTKNFRGQHDALLANAEMLQKKTKFSYEDALAIDTVIAKQQSLTGVIDKGIMTGVEMTNLTADLATVMKVDGAAAATAFAKAMDKPEAASRLLAKAGVDLSYAEEEKIRKLVQSGKTTEAQTILLKELKKQTEGAAEAAGNTMAGKMERAKNAFGEVQESLVVGLLPALTDMLDKGVALTAWAQDNPKTVKIVAGVLGGLAGAVLAVNGAMKVWQATTKAFTGVQLAFNAVMAANPLVLVTALIVGLGIALVVAYKKSETFRNIVNGVFNAIKKTVSTVIGAVKSTVSKGFDFVKNIFLNFTGPGLIIKHFDKIKAGAEKMVNGIKGVFKGLKSAVEGVVNGVKSAWNSTVGGKGISIPSIGIGPFKTPGMSFSIPYLAKGGVANANMPHIVGERGPELFVPGRTGRVVPNHDLPGLGGGPEVIQVVLPGVGVIAEAVLGDLRQKKARGAQIGLA